MAKRRGGKRRIQVEWYGDDILKVFREHGDEALFAMGEHVQEAAKRNAPVGATGNLRKSSYVTTRSRTSFVVRRFWRKNKIPPINAVTVGFSAPHAHLIEGGRRKSGKFGPRGSVSRDGVLRRSGKKALKIGNRFVARSRFKLLRSRPFLAPAVAETRQTMTEVLARKFRSRLEQVLRGNR